MIKRLLGLGLLALVFSFNLFTFGELSVQTNPIESSLIQHYPDQGASSIAKSIGNAGECGIIEPRFEINEIQEVLRKFALVTGLDTVSISPHLFLSNDLLTEAHLFVAGQVEFTILYHNLRI